MKHPPHTPKTKLAKKSMPKPFTDAWLQELQEQLHQHAALANEIQAGGLIVDRQNAAFWLAGAYYWLWLTTDRAFERIAATRHLTQNEIQRAETLHAAYQELKELSQQPPTAPGDPRNALTAAGLRKTLDRLAQSFALAPPPATTAEAVPADLPILSEKASAVLEILLALPSYRGMTGRQILLALDRLEPPIHIDQTTLTKRVIPELKPYGIENKPKIGYRIPESRRISIDAPPIRP